MVDSHWINGYFEGGHFKSTKILENFSEGLPEYNSGLIQNITFKDRNVVTGTQSSYESWMDLNYFTYSNVNLNIYSKNIGISGKTNRVVETYNTNLYGPPTFDVMSSDSYFKNSKTSAIRRYALGSKYQIYSDLLQNYGDFNVPYLSTENYTPQKGSQQDRLVSSIKKSEFINQGWTYSYLSFAELLVSALFSKNYGKSVVYTVSSNTNSDNSGRLNIQLEKFQLYVDLDTNQVVPGTVKLSDVVIFNIKNTKVITKPDRYYFIDLNMNSLPSTQSFIIMSDNSQLTDESAFIHNPSQSDDGLVYPKRFTEYFYNIPGLDLLFYDTRGPGATYSIEKINFYETDSIPFFKYYKTDSEIDFSIKNPYTGIAPVIDYTNNNFDFIGNVELGIDYRTIVQQNSSVAIQSSSSNNKNGSFFSEKYTLISEDGDASEV
jgi:hypothetical protein